MVVRTVYTLRRKCIYIAWPSELGQFRPPPCPLPGGLPLLSQYLLDDIVSLALSPPSNRPSGLV